MPAKRPYTKRAPDPGVPTLTVSIRFSRAEYDSIKRSQQATQPAASVTGFMRWLLLKDIDVKP